MNKIFWLTVFLSAGCADIPKLQVKAVINQSGKKFVVGDTAKLVVVYEALSNLNGEPSYSISTEGGEILKGKESKLQFYSDQGCKDWKGNTDLALKAGEFACTKVNQVSESFPNDAPIEIRITKPKFNLTVKTGESSDTFSFSATASSSTDTTDSTNTDKGNDNDDNDESQADFSFAFDKLLFSPGDCPKNSPVYGCYAFHFLIKATGDSVPTTSSVTYEIANQQHISLLTGGLTGLIKGATGNEGLTACDADSPATSIGGSVKGCNVSASIGVNDAKTAQYAGTASASNPPTFELKIKVDGTLASTFTVTLPTN